MFSLRDDADLREFVLENVEHFGEERVLGTGSYGSVQEVMINGEVYAAKKIHEVLLETDERGGVANLAGNYRRECRLMARIRHPNITQFIGLCFVTGSRLPLLVMERLDSSLDDLLESTPNIPLSVTQYILVCVARGLLHLHRESVVHRDLTARNVLLTASLRAKITDFGNSRIVNLEPGRLARTLTRFPGTLVYMPPEALSDRGHNVYGPSLDVFSFGVLQLFALTQVFPGDLLAPTYSDPNNPDHLLARSEFERRGPYTALLERSLAGGREHPLFGLVRECLANTPERRPTTAELLSSLEEVGRGMDGGLLQLDIGRVKTARTLRAKEKRIEALQREVVQKDRILERKDEQLTEKDALLVQKDNQLEQQGYQLEQNAALLVQKDDQLDQKDRLLVQKDELLVQKDEEVADKDTQLARQQQILNSVRATKDDVIADKDRQLSELESRITDLISQIEGALVERAALLQAHVEQIEHKDAELVRRDAIIQQQRQGPPPRELRPPLTLKCRRGKDMPIKMGTSVQSVVIGDTVYVGGGYADNGRDRCTVMKLEQDQWTKLPEYTAKYFAMTSLANRLVLVGGKDPRNNKPTNQLAVFESGEWTHPYPPMNIARDSSTAFSFNNHIIVAGGRDDKGRISSVEVLDVALRRWYIAQSLPNPRSELKSTLIGNTLYLMGGWDHTGITKTVHHVDLNELIAKALSNLDTPTPWQTLQEVPLVFSAPLSIERSLLAVGGEDDRDNSSSSIHLYQPDTRRWVKVGDLPTARYSCTCSVLPSGEVIVAGGLTSAKLFIITDYIRTVDFLCISN
ncbi:mitogen-activated protein kinase kinase kinase kinase 4-like isoform X3 [Halichondria panicea]|uniref:mitogen-activated protein kinase kinase kinase kinase 4-like isoform X3 n=1 Tax=Halichondria panicea TaxID=6063 RepID=UPI00312BCBC4